MNNIRINRLIKEVLDSSNNLVNIDINDVRDLFQEGGEIHTYDVSVPANEKKQDATIDGTDKEMFQMLCAISSRSGILLYL